MFTTIRAPMYSLASSNLTFGLFAPTSTAPSLSISTAKLSLLILRVFNSLEFSSLRLIGRAPVLLNHLSCFTCILFPHQNNRAADARQNVLRSVQCGYVGIDAHRFKQAVHHHGFRLLFAVEHPDQFLIWIRRSWFRLV